ncbi:hypothetical protein Elgi_35310 [Paenibacillus elgii]|nr:hypothetical protein Elgi_35310 [Paenibacillus elgii]
MNDLQQTRITFRQLLAFFVPLGMSASLVTISHVIINSTLARAASPEIVIASYALPMSILGITDNRRCYCGRHAPLWCATASRSAL